MPGWITQHTVDVYCSGVEESNSKPVTYTKYKYQLATCKNARLRYSNSAVTLIERVKSRPVETSARLKVIQ